MSSRLDCNTPKGQIYIGHQLTCHSRIEKSLNCEVVTTNTESSSDIDALLIKNKTLVGLAEVKSREMNLHIAGDGSIKKLVYEGKEYDSYLVTYEKLEKLKNLSEKFSVSGFLFVYLLEANKIAIWKICDGKGNYTVDMKKARTLTQANCNGNTVYRENAYLSLNSMKILQEKNDY